ncbi:unnamed protein product [Phyllotreta striolata]|uniref:tRNA-binding domain-containing protein n=1 Tax=Phyllotreta striolata TaxID=444603 RepID=A0A9N9TG02_PHYSR|nr:unnamed protein product [Phyllotreta striolata]
MYSKTISCLLNKQIFRGFVGRMSSTPALERAKHNAQITKQTLHELTNEFNVLKREYNVLVAKQLRDENAKLSLAVENAKNKLVRLECQNGVKQIKIPNRSATTSQENSEPNPQVRTETPESKKHQTKPAKATENKPKKPKEQAEEPPIDISRLDLRIGELLDVQKHPDADSLYVLKINVGEENPRTVCSGLVKHIPFEEMKSKSTLVVLCNLKPVKMRGVLSEAMVMCASTEQAVETLIPPAGCKAGEKVHCEGYAGRPDAVMNPKKKIFETVAVDLRTDEDRRACYKMAPLEVAGKGFCVARTLKNAPVK